MEAQLISPKHEGLLTLTLEIIYGHAFKAAPVARVQDVTVVSLQDMKNMISADKAGPRVDETGT